MHLAMNVFHIPPAELAQRLTFYSFIECLTYLDLSAKKDGFDATPEDKLAALMEKYGGLLNAGKKQP